MTVGRFKVFVSIIFVLALTLPVTGACETANIVTQEFMALRRADPRIRALVRNKHPEGVTKFTKERHRACFEFDGATHPSETGFDIALGGLSWMDFVAKQGWDVYATRPPGIRSFNETTRDGPVTR